ncbi:DUF4031 domain-containing protein [Xanthomonas perforans]|uniref:DUF4031 domain-containing protein n=5 Tax=Xanthomonas TaxID=338 RepID=A0A6V7FH61_9XANT|nr:MULTISPECIES: DUF4031 domain-containing protein [Xanthomonas]APO97789.1 hypothetical protein BJD13_00960 [Xanthomonas perforans]APP82616.1 hypothetical protein BJD10_23305 [Xanthomonas hortorum pv. gardneri]APP87330.1 hypothetical protein BI317_25040 [Xanthomonas hortorum pv. gardneri]APR13250.1 hypothetical protein BI314_23700 [Xanthomonas citri pv. citri]APR17909.1 hypothetical protein BI315_23790 [Xanthomonas citri pv. citri]
MTVWVEQARWIRGEQNCGNLLADDLQALHELAERIELARPRFFNGHALIPHYSIPEGLVQAAMDAGATELQLHERERVLQNVRHALASRQRTSAERGPDALPRRRKGQQNLFEV